MRIGLDHVLDRVARLGKAGGEGFDPDRAAAVEVGDHQQIAPVHRVEPEAVDFEPVQRAVGRFRVDHVVARRMGEVAHPAKQSAGDARGAARAAGDFVRAVFGDVGAEQARGAADDLLQFGDAVEIEADRDSEAVAQRRGQQALAGGGADQGEFGKVDADRAGGRAFADHQVERPVLHRRIEDFLDRGSEAVNLVDEQDVAVLEIGQQARRGRPTWR